MTDGLRRLAGEPWTRQVSWRDPRFRDLLSRRDVTVREICLSGSLEDQRQLWGDMAELEARMRRLAASRLDVAVAGYVEAISGQHGIRLEVLLAYTGLNGRDRILGREAAEILGVTHQNISRIAGQLYRNRDRARPPGGIWMPQVDAAVRHGWPARYTAAGVEATCRFFGR